MENQLIACRKELLNTRKLMGEKKNLTDKETTALMLLLHETADVIGMIMQGQMS